MAGSRKNFRVQAHFNAGVQGASDVNLHLGCTWGALGVHQIAHGVHCSQRFKPFKLSNFKIFFNHIYSFQV
jgi:hypothetical protein